MSTGVHTKTAGQLIGDALRAATITGINLPVSSEDFAQAFVALNDILSSWQTQQIHLWSETEAYLPLNKNQSSYVFGTDHAFTDFSYTNVRSDLIAGVTTIDVESTEGMTVGDNIGIELVDDVRQWTTILTIPDENTVTIADPLDDDANENAGVYAYTDGIDQPVRILSVRALVEFDQDEIPAIQLAGFDYYNQPTKTSSGTVNSWYFSRQLNAGVLKVWPVADSVKRALRFTFIKPQYIPEDQSEQIEIPPEWYLPLKFRLAADLGLVYAIDPNKQMMLEQKAESALQDAIGTDDEFSSFLFYPERY